MIKNQSNIYQFVLRDMIGQGMTGLSPTVQIRKDSGSFAAATNTVSEVSDGLYEIALTASECNCDIMAFKVTLPDGQFPAILTNEYLTTTGGATPAEIWGYTGGRMVDNTIPTVNEIWGREAGDTTSRTITNTIPSAADNASAVWSAQTKEVTINSTQAETFATASALSSVASNVGAVKAKTDNLPTSPAAVGSEMALTSAAISSVKSGLATSENISNAQTAIVSRGNEAWITANVSGLATSSGLQSLAIHGDEYWATANVLGALDYYGTAKTRDIPTAEAIWTYPDRGLTTEIVVGISSQNIADITESVWNAPDRTMTDLKPKPNQKSIVCTPSNVINSYGIPRLENWTNETAGTQAFDNKINTYITLAKEKMTTDLNDQINAAIAYIGADNITELCAWLTGYNLYQDDESTDTDSLPETRYNQYLEQIHRIMENI